jgi:hypothetical protein
MLNCSRRFPFSNDKPDRGHGHTYKITDDCASKVQRSKRYLRSRIAGVWTMLNTFVAMALRAIVRAGCCSTCYDYCLRLTAPKCPVCNGATKKVDEDEPVLKQHSTGRVRRLGFPR